MVEYILSEGVLPDDPEEPRSPRSLVPMPERRGL